MTSVQNGHGSLDTNKLTDYSGSSSQSESTVQQVKDAASEKVHAVRDDLSTKVSEKTDAKTTELAEKVEPVTDVVRSASQQLREKGADAPARAVEMLAEKMEDVSAYLRDGDADAFLADIERTARQKPWLVAAGAFGIGLAVSRFLKASAEKEYTDSPAVWPSDQKTARVETTPVLTQPLPTAPYNDYSTDGRAV